MLKPITCVIMHQHENTCPAHVYDCLCGFHANSVLIKQFVCVHKHQHGCETECSNASCLCSTILKMEQQEHAELFYTVIYLFRMQDGEYSSFISARNDYKFNLEIIASIREYLVCFRDSILIPELKKKDDTLRMSLSKIPNIVCEVDFKEWKFKTHMQKSTKMEKLKKNEVGVVSMREEPLIQEELDAGERSTISSVPCSDFFENNPNYHIIDGILGIALPTPLEDTEMKNSILESLRVDGFCKNDNNYHFGGDIIHGSKKAHMKIFIDLYFKMNTHVNIHNINDIHSVMSKCNNQGGYSHKIHRAYNRKTILKETVHRKRKLESAVASETRIEKYFMADESELLIPRILCVNPYDCLNVGFLSKIFSVDSTADIQRFICLQSKQNEFVEKDVSFSLLLGLNQDLEKIYDVIFDYIYMLNECTMHDRKDAVILKTAIRNMDNMILSLNETDKTHTFPSFVHVRVELRILLFYGIFIDLLYDIFFSSRSLIYKINPLGTVAFIDRLDTSILNDEFFEHKDLFRFCELGVEEKKDRLKRHIVNKNIRFSLKTSVYTMPLAFLDTELKTRRLHKKYSNSDIHTKRQIILHNIQSNYFSKTPNLESKVQKIKANMQRNEFFEQLILCSGNIFESLPDEFQDTRVVKEFQRHFLESFAKVKTWIKY